MRKDDSQLNRGVVLASKLLFAMSIEAKWGLIEFVSSPADVVKKIQTECGCRWLVIERPDLSSAIQATRYLRQALLSKEFRLVRSFRIEADDVQGIDVYEYLGNIEYPSAYLLHFPILGQNTSFTVNPLIPRTPLR